MGYNALLIASVESVTDPELSDEVGSDHETIAEGEPGLLPVVKFGGHPKIAGMAMSRFIQ